TRRMSTPTSTWMRLQSPLTPARHFVPSWTLGVRGRGSRFLRVFEKPPERRRLFFCPIFLTAVENGAIVCVVRNFSYKSSLESHSFYCLAVPWPSPTRSFLLLRRRGARRAIGPQRA